MRPGLFRGRPENSAGYGASSGRFATGFGEGIFLGDLHYYFAEGDLRNGLLDTLDTKKCPLHLLTGEYDLSATPQLTAELAKAVNATSFQVMEGLGHFPMSENPAQFRKYLLPVLERVAAGA